VRRDGALAAARRLMELSTSRGRNTHSEP
jgi:hypothetical protein